MAFATTGEITWISIEALLHVPYIGFALSYVSMALAAVQVVLMLGVFIFNITRLREFVGYFLGAILSLISFGGMIFAVIVALAKLLQDF